MPDVFISYAQDDSNVVKEIAGALIENGISAWRDQESIYGSQQWPEAIGEAISSKDLFLLVWSKNAAGSHFVTFEWTTALALRKRILPCILDDTPLPPSLRAIHGIFLKDFEDALPRILESLKQPTIEVEREHSAKVIRKLQGIPSTEPEEVVRVAETTFFQQGWKVLGNVYQTGDGIHLTNEQAPKKHEKRLWEKWQAWVTLFVGLLTIITILLDLPKKIDSFLGSFNKADTQLVQPLSGIIWNEENEPLAGVIVFLPEFNLTDTTDWTGKFEFRVKAPKQISVNLIARKDGYYTQDLDATLGNTSFNFTMRRKK